ncbi:hypothetical protein CBR_g49154 [Chara braunii]|uniref:Integrase catalytic domain-containing protein n=1 Tax=Chara braunii TaxID=69332 RepID=A0A388K4U9_CHABU|nr:hypothetical protein CBR_g49154 [Chara braunii]|eukprot:GBG65080.1 hypothetical protein CBR_g49154 [Chara braunii]
MARWLSSPTYSGGPEMSVDVRSGVSVVMPEEGTWTDLEPAYQIVMLVESDAFLWIETMWTKVSLTRLAPSLLDLEFGGTVEARGWVYLSKEKENAMIIEFVLGLLPYKLFKEVEREVVWAACQRVEMVMEAIDVRVELGDRGNVRKPFRTLRCVMLPFMVDAVFGTRSRLVRICRSMASLGLYQGVRQDFLRLSVEKGSFEGNWARELATMLNHLSMDGLFVPSNVHWRIVYRNVAIGETFLEGVQDLWGSRMARGLQLRDCTFKGWELRRIEGGVEMSIPADNEWRGTTCDWVGLEIVSELSYLWVERVWNPLREEEGWEEIAEGRVESVGTVILSEQGWHLFCTTLAAGQSPMWLLGDAEARTRKAGERFANKSWDVVRSKVVMGGWKEFRPPCLRTKIWVPEFTADWFGGFDHVAEVASTMRRVHVNCAWLTEEFYKTSLKSGPFHSDRAREVLIILDMDRSDRPEVAPEIREAIIRREVAATPCYVDDVFKLFEFSEFDKDKILSVYQQTSKFEYTRDVDFSTVTDLAEKTVVTETLALFKEGEVIDLTGKTRDKVKKGIEGLHERVHGVDNKIERVENALLVMQAQVSRPALPPQEAVVPAAVANRGYDRKDPANEQCRYCTMISHFVRTCPRLNHDIMRQRCSRSLEGKIFGPQGERINWNSPGGMRRAVIFLSNLDIAVVEAEQVADIVWDQQRGRGAQVNFILEGYDQLPLDARDRPYTAMHTPVGQLQMQVTPMGFTNAVAEAQRRMLAVAGDMFPKKCEPYVDDNPIKGAQNKDETEVQPGVRKFVWDHLQDIKDLLQRFQVYNITASGSKSILAVPDLTIQGFRCGAYGRKPDPTKTDKISQWPTPLRTTTEVRTFLGMVGFWRIFIKGFAKIAKPIRVMIRNGGTMEWTEDREATVQTLKDILSSDQVTLATPCFNDKMGRPFILENDGGPLAVGGVLIQRSEEGRERLYQIREYILDAKDNLSGYVEAVALKRKTGKGVADWIEDFYLRHPFIRRFITDNGTEFVNYEVLSRLKMLCVPIKIIEPYHSEANAPVEKGHRTLKNTIAKLAADDLRNWPRYLKQAIFLENMMPKRTTGCIPVELWYGREIDFPVEPLVPTWNRLDDNPHMSTEELITARCQQVLRNEEALEDVVKRVMDSRMRDKARWDQVKNIRKELLQVGEIVLVRNSDLESMWSGQLGRRFKGPYRVAKWVGLNTFELEDLDGTGLKGSFPGQREPTSSEKKHERQKTVREEVAEQTRRMKRMEGYSEPMIGGDEGDVGERASGKRTSGMRGGQEQGVKKNQSKQEGATTSKNAKRPDGLTIHEGKAMGEGDSARLGIAAAREPSEKSKRKLAAEEGDGQKKPRRRKTAEGTSGGERAVGRQYDEVATFWLEYERHDDGEIVEKELPIQQLIDPRKVCDIPLWERYYNHRRLHSLTRDGAEDIKGVMLRQFHEEKGKIWTKNPFVVAPIYKPVTHKTERAQRVHKDVFKPEDKDKYFYYPVNGQHTVAAVKELAGEPIFELWKMHSWPARVVWFSDEDFGGYLQSPNDAHWMMARKATTLADKDHIAVIGNASRQWMPLVTTGDEVFHKGMEFYDKWAEGKLLGGDGKTPLSKPGKYMPAKSPGLQAIPEMGAKGAAGETRIGWLVRVPPPLTKKKTQSDDLFFIVVKEPDMLCWQSLADMTDAENMSILDDILAPRGVFVQSAGGHPKRQHKPGIKDMVAMRKVDRMMLRMFHYILFLESEEDAEVWRYGSQFFRTEEQLLAEFAPQGLTKQVWVELQKHFHGAVEYVNTCKHCLPYEKGSLDETKKMYDDERFPKSFEKSVRSILRRTEEEVQDMIRVSEDVRQIKWYKINRVTSLIPFSCPASQAHTRLTEIREIVRHYVCNLYVLDFCDPTLLSNWQEDDFASLQDVLQTLSPRHWALVVFFPFRWELSFLKGMAKLSVHNVRTGKWVRHAQRKATVWEGDMLVEEYDRLYVVFNDENLADNTVAVFPASSPSKPPRANAPSPAKPAVAARSKVACSSDPSGHGLFRRGRRGQVPS